MSLVEKVERAKGDYDEVFEAGKDAEYNRFWTTHLAKTKDGMYAYCGRGWDDATFNPPRGTVLRPTYANNMFAHTGITDFVTLCNTRGITLDFSQSTSMTSIFYAPSNAKLMHVGVIDATKTSGSITQTFYGQTNLHTIDKFIFKSDGSQTFNDTFKNCTSLANITIEGTIGNNLDVHWSPLSETSLLSIINALKSGVSSKTLTLGSTNLAKLTDAEKAIATQKGWTLA